MVRGVGLLCESHNVPLGHRALGHLHHLGLARSDTACVERGNRLLVEQMLALPEEGHRALARHLVLQMDKPERFGDKRLHTFVVLDHEAQRRKLARAVADHHPLELRDGAAECVGL